MKVVHDFEDYQLLDMADGNKLESWHNIILERPDPQIIWQKKSYPGLWEHIDAKYIRSNTGGGRWQINNKVPETFFVKYQDLTFALKLMSFKHTGLFPEQAYNWNIIRDKIKSEKRSIKVLNLFAYTGASSIAALKEGAEVTHVDASKGMIEWAKENVVLNNLENSKIRFIIDDVIKFVKREIKREQKYDIIIMDPPSFGRGSKNEVWSIEKDLYNLVELCTEILSDRPVMFLINSYTTGLSVNVLENILKLLINNKHPGIITSDELGLLVKDSNLILPCGIFARWESI